METTLWIGIAVIVLGTGLGAIMMFGQRSNPLAESAANSRASMTTIPPSAATPSDDLGRSSASADESTPSRAIYRGSDDAGVKIRWYQRLRALVMLLLITIGLGMAVGAIFGAVALVVSLVLG